MTTLRSREEEAGQLYIEGYKAVREGGHELSMLSGHLCHMLQGTVQFPGALWQVRRVPPEGLLIEQDRFIDYLLEPARRGLGLPSLHFLRQTLNAMPDGPETLALVREQFVAERMDFDALADQARDTALLKGKVGRTGAHKGTNLVPLPKSGTKREAARLADRRPDLADQVRAGTMKLSTALIEAGIRKVKTSLDQLEYWWNKANKQERAEFMKRRKHAKSR
jgi:hypothetical protein